MSQSTPRTRPQEASGAPVPGRTLLLVLAHNAESTIRELIERIPLPDLGSVEVVILDDSSEDRTFELGLQYERAGEIPVNVLRTPVLQGHGGAQKLGLQYAINRSFDRVALLDGDGRYPPEKLPELVAPIAQGVAEAVIGTRMTEGWKAITRGMPWYKYLGNRVLTSLQNRAQGTHLSDWHSGFRAYSVAALEAIPFGYNTNDWHFDTEVTIQLILRGYRIREVAIPAHGGRELRHLRGVRYAWRALATTAVSRLQSLGILYRRKYAQPVGESPYCLKLAFPSSHSFAAEAISSGEAVLDLGCGVGYVAEALESLRGCRVTGVDRMPASSPGVLARMTRYVEHDLNDGTLPTGLGTEFDTILLLDIIEHLRAPERLMETIRRTFSETRPRVILTTPNIAFVALRIGLLLGSFHYGPRGILDLTHTRLFTFKTLRQLLEECGFEIHRIRGIPAPFPLAIGGSLLAKLLLRLNGALLAVLPSVFSYQIYVEVEMAPTVEELVVRTIEGSDVAKQKWPAPEAEESQPDRDEVSALSPGG